ncbi:MAG TPA: hypothetical protein DCL73_11285 [Treponema sp.]|nr:hypothetical protein [Treponema sp.]
MEHSKLVLLLVLFIAAGIVFSAVGLCLLSEKYLNQIGGKRAMGKAAGWSAFGIGVLTIFTGIFIFSVPSVLEYIIVGYLGILFIAAYAAMIVVKLKK